MRFRAKNGAIRELIAPLRANQIARITSDFKMDLTKAKIGGHRLFLPGICPEEHP